jgi:glycosyltransferase involved in cell wall biosynthesis
VRGANALWFVTQTHRERFLELLPERERESVRARTLVAPMGIELPDIAADRQQARRALGLSRFSVLALGRLVPVKGIDVLLRASRDRPWTLLIAGDGPERSRLEAEARRLRVDARFFGEVANPQKSLLLTAADAFALPSRVLPSGRSEGSPVALLEAMACGLPTVGSAVGGIAELLPQNDSAGLLVPADQPESLANALERLRLDDALRSNLGRRARELVARHRWSRTIEPALSVLSSSQRHPLISPTP